jgi:ABC-2 type transport system permease protein
VFSKPIFKQTLKGNYRLWLIFTAILCVISSITISVFDPKMISSMMEMLKDTPMAEMAGDQLDSLTTLLGMLSQQFYSMLAVILPMIFIIITANSVIAAQVDRGSMAYLLSTPTKRWTVVRTQALYLVTAVLAMFLTVTVVGLSTVQLAHSGLWGQQYTPDVVAAATVLDRDKSEVADHLDLILADAAATEAGAGARAVEEDVYLAYIGQKQAQNAYAAAADVLDRPTAEVADDPSLILANEAAVVAAAGVVGVDAAAYRTELTAMIEGAAQAQSSQVQNQLVAGVAAAAEVLGLEPAELFDDMAKIKSNRAALAAAVTTSGLPEEMIVGIIDGQLATDELALDEGIEFSIKDYLMLNLGAFLLMFAISGISFLFSCVFNLSKNSLALGAGLPIAFFIFKIVSEIGDSLSGFRYLSLNTLFNTEAVVNGGSYALQFGVLGLLGVVLYVVGMRWFTQKDLPL